MIIKKNGRIETILQNNTKKDIKLFLLIGLYIFKNTNSHFCSLTPYNISTSILQEVTYSKKGIYKYGPFIKYNYSSMRSWHIFYSIILNCFIKRHIEPSRSAKILSFDTRHNNKYFSLSYDISKNRKYGSFQSWHTPSAYIDLMFFYDFLDKR